MLISMIPFFQCLLIVEKSLHGPWLLPNQRQQCVIAFGQRVISGHKELAFGQRIEVHTPIWADVPIKNREKCAGVKARDSFAILDQIADIAAIGQNAKDGIVLADNQLIVILPVAGDADCGGFKVGIAYGFCPINGENQLGVIAFVFDAANQHVG